MGGDAAQTRHELNSPDCDRFKQMLNDCAKYAVICKRHMEATGLQFQDL